MLQRLVIQNFKLIAALDLDFPDGTCAITGETGAGKSSVVQALEAALGGEMHADTVRPGCERGEVQAWFDIRNAPQARAWLAEQDLPPDLEHSCVLRRTFRAEGPSRAYINGSACTLAMLGEVGALLADMVVQNHHLAMLQPQTQLALVDAAWDSREALSEMARLHREHLRLNEAVAQLTAKQPTAGQQREFLAAQLEALDEMALEEDSLPQWEAEHSRLSRSEDFVQAMNQAEAMLQGGPQSATSLLAQVRRLVPAATTDADPVNAIHQSLATADEMLAEAVQEMSRQANDMQNHSQRLAELETLLSQCHELARRHNCPPRELWQRRKTWQQELEQLTTLGERLAELEQQRDRARQQWQKLARHCSAERERAAAGICDKVSQLLGQLGMRKASFQIALVRPDDTAATPGEAEVTVRRSGLEKAAFLYSPAPGVPAAALGRIASGGELSRLHLALQLSTAQYLAQDLAQGAGGDEVAGRAGLVVLDEADAGIGGETAQRLAELVRQLGESVQVLCVTHLPQLAAAAHHHLRAQKLDGDAPQLQVDFLDNDERTAELARMLGGGKAGAESRQLAERLLSGAAQAAG